MSEADETFAEYARSLSKGQLTDEEKRQAIHRLALEMLVYGDEWPEYYRRRCKAAAAALHDLELRE